MVYLFTGLVQLKSPGLECTEVFEAFDAKLAVRDTLGEVRTDPVSLLEVVWFEP